MRFFLTIVGFVAALVPAIAGAAGLTPAQVRGIEAAVSDGMTQRHIPSVVVRVDVDGAPVYQHAFGLRDLGNHVPASVSTNYQYGSITKQFTAAAILMLAQDGKLSLDDRIGKWVPAFAKFPVTIRELLIHVSGIADFTSNEQYELKIGPLPFVGYEWGLNWAAARPLDFKPGTKAAYDNTGYVLLARVVEKASGKTFGRFLHDEIFQPLGMNGVRGFDMLRIEPNVANGYIAWSQEFAQANAGIQPAQQLDALVNAWAWNLRQVDGAGYLVGDAADLQRWDDALLAGKLLHGKWRDTFYRPGTLADGTPAYAGGDNKMKSRPTYCYGGLAKTQVQGVTVYGANGGTIGFLAFTATIPSKHMSVTILTNEGQIDNSKLTTPILDALVESR
ncbi:MAG TPA: serine hydrolase domain-containing protein [Candidatus Baltobacteraceae bacterium]|nr:serine hydrolase domain-containing protein [Candidatus Baltobacteraceae bacterium]